MANILTQTLPAEVETENGTFKPVTDFRASIEFEIMVENGEQDIFNLMQPYYPNGLPKGHEVDAVKAALWFYQCGEENKKQNENKPVSKKRAYSFAFDAEAIYSDFSRYYNVDLTDVKLHWWKFRALLAGLPNESTFKERIYYRTCDLKGLSKNEKKRISEIRKHIEIKTEDNKQNISLEKRNADMLAYVQKRQNELNKGVQ